MKKVIFISFLSFLFLVGCSQNIEKEIIGTWKNAKTDDDCDTNMDEKITFDEDGDIIGIEGYKNYKIDETNHEDYDYAILSGGIEDSARYRVKIDQDNYLHIVYEEDDLYDFDDGIACYMEKVSD